MVCMIDIQLLINQRYNFQFSPVPVVAHVVSQVLGLGPVDVSGLAGQPGIAQSRKIGYCQKYKIYNAIKVESGDS